MSGERAPETPLAERIMLLRGTIRESLAGDRPGIDRFIDACVAYGQELKKKYPDAQNWRAYHALLGSTLPADKLGVIEEDFPGEDSVVAFLENLRR